MKKMLLLGLIVLAVSLIIIGCDSKPNKSTTKKPGKKTIASKTTKTEPVEKEEPPKPPEPKPIVVDNPVTVTTTSGLQYCDTVIGVGDEALSGYTVWVHYTGWFADGGKKFDSSFDHLPKKEPFSFTIDHGGVIKGWQEGVRGMRVGGKRRLVVPPDLGYGKDGYAIIPPNSTLIFDLELMHVEK